MNAALTGSGGGIFSTRAYVNITGAVFKKNSAVWGGGWSSVL